MYTVRAVRLRGRIYSRGKDSPIFRSTRSGSPVGSAVASQSHAKRPFHHVRDPPMFFPLSLRNSPTALSRSTCASCDLPRCGFAPRRFPTSGTSFIFLSLLFFFWPSYCASTGTVSSQAVINICASQSTRSDNRFGSFPPLKDLREQGGFHVNSLLIIARTHCVRTARKRNRHPIFHLRAILYPDYTLSRSCLFANCPFSTVLGSCLAAASSFLTFAGASSSLAGHSFFITSSFASWTKLHRRRHVWGESNSRGVDRALVKF